MQPYFDPTRKMTSKKGGGNGRQPQKKMNIEDGLNDDLKKHERQPKKKY